MSDKMKRFYEKKQVNVKFNEDSTCYDYLLTKLIVRI